MNCLAHAALGGTLRIAQLAAETALNDVAHTGGAVVVEETIAIDAILRLAVDKQRIEQTVGLSLGDIEHLLIDIDALATIGLNKVCRLLHGTDIVGVAQGEAEGEIAGVEVEDAIVEHEVEPASACR